MVVNVDMVGAEVVLEDVVGHVVAMVIFNMRRDDVNFL